MDFGHVDSVLVEMGAMGLRHAFALKERNESGVWEAQTQCYGRKTDKFGLEIQSWREKYSHVMGIFRLCDAKQDGIA